MPVTIASAVPANAAASRANHAAPAAATLDTSLQNSDNPFTQTAQAGFAGALQRQQKPDAAIATALLRPAAPAIDPAITGKIVQAPSPIIAAASINRVPAPQVIGLRRAAHAGSRSAPDPGSPAILTAPPAAMVVPPLPVPPLPVPPLPVPPVAVQPVPVQPAPAQLMPARANAAQAGTAPATATGDPAAANSPSPGASAASIANTALIAGLQVRMRVLPQTQSAAASRSAAIQGHSEQPSAPAKGAVPAAQVVQPAPNIAATEIATSQRAVSNRTPPDKAGTATSVPADTTAIGSTVAPPVPDMAAHLAGNPSPHTPGAIAPPQAPADFATIVDTIARARADNAATPGAAAVGVTLQHADFGRVSMQISPRGQGLAVTMRSADPGFAPAVSAAVDGAGNAGSSTGSNTGQDTGQQDPRHHHPAEPTAASQANQTPGSAGFDQSASGGDRNGFDQNARQTPYPPGGQTRPASSSPTAPVGSATADPAGIFA